MRMCVWWARGGGDAVALAWSLRRAAPRLLLDDADPAVSTSFVVKYFYFHIESFTRIHSTSRLRKQTRRLDNVISCVLGRALLAFHVGLVRPNFEKRVWTLRFGDTFGAKVSPNFLSETF